MKKKLNRIIGGIVGFVAAMGISASAYGQLLLPYDTSIVNKATVDYTRGDGVAKTGLESNMVTTKISAVYDLTLTNGGEVNVTPGGNVSFGHVITNTGNIAATYSFSNNYTGGYTNLDLAVNFDRSTEVNGDGVTVDTLEQSEFIGFGNNTVLTLEPGESWNVYLFAKTPSNATVPSTETFELKATAYTAARGTVTPTVEEIGTEIIHYSNDADVGVGKSLSSYSGDGSQEHTVTVTLNVYNPKVGALAAANTFVLSDVLDPKFIYQSGTAKWLPFTGGTAVTLSDADGTESGLTGVKFKYEKRQSDNKEVLTVEIADIPANIASSANVGKLTFDVKVPSGTVAGNITNTANYTYKTSSGVSSGDKSSNTVSYAVGAYSNFTFTGQTLTSGRIGEILEFKNILTNNGNATDVYDIKLSPDILANTAFPADTWIDMIDTTGGQYTPILGSPVQKKFLGTGTAGMGQYEGEGALGRTLTQYTLAPGESREITIYAKFPANTPLIDNNSNIIIYEIDKTATSNGYQTTKTAQDIVNQIEVGPAILVDMTNSGKVYENGSIVYTHRITNTGTVELSGTFFTLAASNSNSAWTTAPVIYVDSDKNGTYESGTDLVYDGGTNNIGTIAIGAEVKFFVKVTSPPGASPNDINTTTITATKKSPNGDYLIVSNFASDTTTVISDEVTIEKYQSKTGNGTDWTKASLTALPETNLYYKIVVTNTSTVEKNLTDVVIKDTTPTYTKLSGTGSPSYNTVPSYTTDGTAYTEVSTKPAVGGTGLISQTIPTLEPNKSVTLYFNVKIDKYSN